MLPIYITECDLYTTNVEDENTTVNPSKLSYNKNIFRIEEKFGEFHQFYYITSIENLPYHCSYYQIYGENYVVHLR